MFCCGLFERYYEWAITEPRIAGFNPWHFEKRGSPQHGPPCDMELGLVDLPNALSAMTKIGKDIVGNTRV